MRVTHDHLMLRVAKYGAAAALVVCTILIASCDVCPEGHECTPTQEKAPEGIDAVAQALERQDSVRVVVRLQPGDTKDGQKVSATDLAIARADLHKTMLRAGVEGYRAGAVVGDGDAVQMTVTSHEQLERLQAAGVASVAVVPPESWLGPAQVVETEPGVQVSVDRALVRIVRTHVEDLFDTKRPGADSGPLLDAIQACAASTEDGAAQNLSALRTAIQQCVSSEYGSLAGNVGATLDHIEACVADEQTLSAGRPVLINLVNECVDRLRPPPRPSIAACIESRGGRIVRYLPQSSTVLVVFETDELSELQGKLNDLKANGCGNMPLKVTNAVPVVFLKQHQASYDNDNLPAPHHLAYSLINSSQASAFIRDTPGLGRKANVAVIDGQLYSGFGQGDELAAVDFYDLCEASGQQGIPSDPPPPGASADPHGSMVTGIIAAANNGHGNNGVIRIAPPYPGRVSFFRTDCNADSPGIDPALVMIALEQIVEGAVSGVRVVNMSFGLESSNQDYLDQYRSLFRRYFSSSQGTDVVWVGSVGDSGLSLNAGAVVPAGLSSTLENVISVAAYDTSTINRATLSNYGNWVDISAPGVGVYTPATAGGYGGLDGTSAAAALVTGSIGLVLAADSGLSPVEVKDLIKDPSRQKPLATTEIPGGVDAEKLVRVLIPGASRSVVSDGSGSVSSATGLRQPGLAGFFFNYKGGGDHELKAIGAEFSDTGIATLEYRDKDDDPGFWWRIQGRNLPYGTRFGSAQFSLQKSGDQLVMPVSQAIAGANTNDHVIGLTGFNCRYDDGDDHNLQEIGVSVFGNNLGNWQMLASFGDDSDSLWTCRVGYAIIENTRVLGELITGSGSDEGKGYIPVNHFPDVIQSFSLAYDDNDHHVDRISIYAEQGAVWMRLNDGNDDDTFNWDLSYYRLR